MRSDRRKGYMKIPNQIHQFEGKRALIMVAGKQDALFYEAHDGVIEEIDSLKLPHSSFFNDGPFYKARSQGGMTRSGPVREVQDQKVVSDFIRELKKHMDKVRADIYSDVYVMAPAKSKTALVQAMPDSLRKKVIRVFPGNFFNKNPLDIIQKIHTRDKQQFIPTKAEEQHILENAKQASQFMRGKY